MIWSALTRTPQVANTMLFIPADGCGGPSAQHGGGLPGKGEGKDSGLGLGVAV